MLLCSEGKTEKHVEERGHSLVMASSEGVWMHLTRRAKLTSSTESFHDFFFFPIIGNFESNSAVDVIDFGNNQGATIRVVYRDIVTTRGVRSTETFSACGLLGHLHYRLQFSIVI